MTDETRIVLVVEIIVLLIIIVLLSIYILAIIFIRRFHTVPNILTGNACLDKKDYLSDKHGLPFHQVFNGW
jgi:hypothetical protein